MAYTERMSPHPPNTEETIDFIVRSAKLRMLGEINDATLGLVGYLFEKGHPVSAQKRWMSHRLFNGKGPYNTAMIALVWKREGDLPDLVIDLRGNQGWDAIFEYRKNSLLKISPNASRDHYLKAECEEISGRDAYLRKGLDAGAYRAHMKIEAVEHKIQAFLLSRNTPTAAPVRSTRPRI